MTFKKVIVDRVEHVCAARDIHDDDIFGYIQPGVITWEVSQIKTDRNGENRTLNVVVEIVFCPYCGEKLPESPADIEMAFE